MLRGFPLDQPPRGGRSLADLPYVSVPAAGHAPAVWRLVVPARVLRIPHGIGSVRVRFSFHLNHREGQADVPVPRARLKELRVGSHAYLIVALSRGQLQCEYDPDAAAIAIESALTASDEDELPLAQLAGHPAAAPPLEAKCAFKLTADEVGEAVMLAGDGSLTAHQTPASIRRGLFGWILFGVLVTVLFLMLNHSGNRRGPAAPPITVSTPAASPWQKPVRIAGATLAVAGVIGTIAGLRGMRRRAEGDGMIDVQAGEVAFVSGDARGQSTHEWAYFDRLIETPRLFVLFAGLVVHVIPKRAVDDGQLARLRHLLNRKVAATGCFT